MTSLRWRRSAGSVRRSVGAASVLVALAIGACGGGDKDSSEAPESPGANVDPDSSNVITDPINKAKDAAERQEERDAQVDQSNSDY